MTQIFLQDVQVDFLGSSATEIYCLLNAHRLSLQALYSLFVEPCQPLYLNAGLCESDHERCEGPGPTNGYWSNADWLLGRDGKWRPVRPGTFPLAHGVAQRVGRLRAYGNGINLEKTAEFIRAAMPELTHVN